MAKRRTRATITSRFTRSPVLLLITNIRRLTREQREEAYNKARERIFGNSEKTGESTPGKFISGHITSYLANNTQKPRMPMACPAPVPFPVRKSPISGDAERRASNDVTTQKVSIPDLSTHRITEPILISQAGPRLGNTLQSEICHTMVRCSSPTRPPCHKATLRLAPRIRR